MNIQTKSILLSLSMIASGRAFAADSATPTTPWYAGASIGEAHNRFEQSDFTANDPSIGETSNESDTAGKIYMGYTISPHLAIEGGYTDFGKFDYRYSGSGATAGTSADARYKVDALHVEAVGSLPLANNFSLFGKLGVAQTRATDDLSSTIGSAPGTSQVSSSTSYRTNPLLGVGLNYNLTQKVALRAEYEDYGRVGDADDTGRARENLLSVGLKYSF